MDFFNLKHAIASSALVAMACACASAPSPATEEVSAEPKKEGLSIKAPPIDQKKAKVSTSAGQEGGFVVLWPRVIPSAARDELGDTVPELQKRLEFVSQSADPNRPMDLRPEPERVCPKAGCKAVSTGVLLLRGSKGGCAAVAMVSAPGQSEALLLPWVGQVELTTPTIPFRAPPESSVTVTDFVPCDELVERGKKAEAALEEAIAEVARTSP